LLDALRQGKPACETASQPAESNLLGFSNITSLRTRRDGTVTAWEIHRLPIATGLGGEKSAGIERLEGTYSTRSILVAQLRACRRQLGLTRAVSDRVWTIAESLAY